MKIHKIRDLAILSFAFIFTLLLPGALQAGIPSVEDVVNGKADMPTIADLTGGKIQNNGQIDRSNVDIVKEYLPVGLYELVKRGMVLTMGTQQPAEKTNPKIFYDSTEKNRGKAILSKSGAVYYEKQGTLWPGGYPFPWVKNGVEGIANTYYGKVWDSYHNYPVNYWWVNSKGEVYKSMLQEQIYVKTSGRMLYPPLGVVPGYEDTLIVRVTGATYPLEIKGLGQYTVRHYDQSQEDTGFAYVPAFKRTLRVNANSWQDNAGGSDFTYGDGDAGFQEPIVNWDFKLLGKKFSLITEAKSPFPYIEKDGAVSTRVKFDMGKKYPRFGWVVAPVDIVEGTPKIKHIYGKKVMYMPIYPYVTSSTAIMSIDIYDRQMKLWKSYNVLRGDLSNIGGDPQKPMTGPWCASLYDLQADHATLLWIKGSFAYVNPADMNLGRLLRLSR